MSLARDLVALDQQLRREGVDPFASLEEGGLLSAAETAGVLGRLESLAYADPARVLRLCLQAMRVQHDELKPRLLEAELVATLPPEVPGIARPTSQVLIEMLRPPIGEVILLGYEVSDETMMRLLGDAAAAGATVIAICDRERGAAQRLLERWPRDVQKPRIFQDRQRRDVARYASMHAKCLLVDGDDLLVTSANFTFHGLHGNIEIGIRLSGDPATEARKIFSHLVESRILEEVAC